MKSANTARCFSLGVIKLIVIARRGCGCGGQASRRRRGGEGSLFFASRIGSGAWVNKWICMAWIVRSGSMIGKGREERSLFASLFSLSFHDRW